jgi:hypothetical protein
MHTDRSDDPLDISPVPLMGTYSYRVASKASMRHSQRNCTLSGENFARFEDEKANEASRANETP